MDPITIARLGRMRQQETLAWAAREDRRPPRRRWTLPASFALFRHERRRPAPPLSVAVNRRKHDTCDLPQSGM